MRLAQCGSAVGDPTGIQGPQWGVEMGEDEVRMVVRMEASRCEKEV